MTQKEVLVYGGSDGTIFKGRSGSSSKTQLKKWYGSMKYVGYLSGYRYDITGTVGVMAFFKEKPTAAEIQKRRDNGFKAAKWNWL